MAGILQELRELGAEMLAALAAIPGMIDGWLREQDRKATIRRELAAVWKAPYCMWPNERAIAPGPFESLTPAQQEKVLAIIGVPEFNDIVVPSQYEITRGRWRIGAAYCVPGGEFGLSRGWQLWEEHDPREARRAMWLASGRTVAEFEAQEAREREAGAE